MKQNSSAATYTPCRWSLANGHFLYVPTVSNAITNGNGSVNENVLKLVMARIAQWGELATP